MNTKLSHAFLIAAAALSAPAFAQSEARVEQWMAPQNWVRNSDAAVVSLGQPGEFDDMHLLSPTVALEDGRYSLWYCGSQGKVADRRFRLGLATSTDGTHFAKHSANPVFEIPGAAASVLTPTLLRRLDGTPIRENGRLRLWFSSTDFHDSTGRHTLHETTSEDGQHWSEPSPALLEGVYAPSVLKDETGYRLWYTDVTKNPWIIRYATSPDGRAWQVAPEPAVVIDQPWEQGRLFYPCVVNADGLYLMWYGSYWRDHPSNTALGFAVSTDGLHWRKYPQNPVFTPDPTRPWESHYTTSQSIIRLPDGSWQMWYASRTQPPFRHKYFAIATARWSGPAREK